jgi:hypothetical protein
MKILMAILLVILMIGVTPAFAVDSSANSQTVTSTAIKGINGDIEDTSQVTDQSNEDMVSSFDASDMADEDSGYIDGYDEDGNYIGNYDVVDPLNSENMSDQPEDTNNSLVSSFDASNMPDEDSDYIDEPDSSHMVNSASIDQFDEDDDTEFGNDYTIDSLDTPGEDVDYIGHDVNDYIVDESEVSDQPDENDSFDELNTDQFDEDEYYTVTELDIEFGYNESFDADQLNESPDDVDELGNGNYTIIDPSDDQLSENETTSQIDTNVPTNCKPLILTIVNGLCGVVQATLEGVGNVCAVLENELETIL